MQKSSRCWKDSLRSGQVNLLHVFKRSSQELHVPCFACFLRKRNALLNLEVSDSFNGDFIRVSKVIIALLLPSWYHNTKLQISIGLYIWYELLQKMPSYILSTYLTSDAALRKHWLKFRWLLISSSFFVVEY